MAKFVRYLYRHNGDNKGSRRRTLAGKSYRSGAGKGTLAYKGVLGVKISMKIDNVRESERRGGRCTIVDEGYPLPMIVHRAKTISKKIYLTFFLSQPASLRIIARSFLLFLLSRSISLFNFYDRAPPPAS